MVQKGFNSKTDTELVNLTLAEPDAFRYLVERYDDKLLRYIRRTMFVNKEEAEDILQEVFIKVYENLNGFNPKYKFSSWIYRITYNTSISFYRKNNKYQGHDSVDAKDKKIKELVGDIDLEAGLIREHDAMSVQSALKHLDEKYRTALVLKYLEELDYEEISEIMHIPSGTVGSLINRGKKIFKDLLTNNGQFKQ